MASGNIKHINTVGRCTMHDSNVVKSKLKLDELEFSLCIECSGVFQFDTEMHHFENGLLRALGKKRAVSGNTT